MDDKEISVTVYTIVVNNDQRFVAMSPEDYEKILEVLQKYANVKVVGELSFNEPQIKGDTHE